MLAQAGRKVHEKHTHIHIYAHIYTYIDTYTHILRHTHIPMCGASIYQQTLKSFSLQMSLCYTPSAPSLTDFLPSGKSLRPLHSRSTIYVAFNFWK